METPSLKHLMAAYFHQDFDIHGGPWDVADLFFQEEPVLTASLPAEIAWATSKFSSDEELKGFLDDLGNHFAADRVGTTYHMWLREIARRAHAQTASKL